MSNYNGYLSVSEIHTRGSKKQQDWHATNLELERERG